MKVFFDTNVLAAAFGTRGLCADVLRATLAEHDLLTSEFVLEELERVLMQRFGMPQRSVDAILRFLRRFHVEPTPNYVPEVAVRDPDDIKVLSSALAAKADVLVTGDQDLLCIKDQVDITITDPRGFWNLLKQRTNCNHPLK